MSYYDEEENETTASEVIEREHELLGEKGKPGKKEKRVHKILRDEFDDEEEDDNNDSHDYNFDMKMGDELDKGIKLPDLIFGGITDTAFGYSEDNSVIEKGVRKLRKTAKKTIRKPKDVSFEPNFENIFGSGWG